MLKIYSIMLKKLKYFGLGKIFILTNNVELNNGQSLVKMHKKYWPINKITKK